MVSCLVHTPSTRGLPFANIFLPVSVLENICTSCAHSHWMWAIIWIAAWYFPTRASCVCCWTHLYFNCTITTAAPAITNATGTWCGTITTSVIQVLKSIIFCVTKITTLLLCAIRCWPVCAFVRRFCSLCV